MEKICRFIECLIPVTVCNLKCEYCYIIQEERRSSELPKMQYSAEQIGKALRKERLGGTCYFSICGAGETLVPQETVDIVFELLKAGHYVNITTNGTLKKRFEQIQRFPAPFLKRLHFAFSLHYLELKNKNMLKIFSDNVNLMRKAGCSFLVQLNLYDGYIPYLTEIEEYCIENFGAKPQVAATRDEESVPFKLHTSLSEKEYLKIGQKMNSPLFNFTMENFMVKRKEYCYAGDWSFVLDLDSGIMRRCYNIPFGVNIFENPEEPIKFEAVGHGCRKEFCVNSSHFLSLGVIPSIEAPTYAELRNRQDASWYTDEMQQFLSQKLSDSHNLYSPMKKTMVGIKDQYRRKKLFLKRVLRIKR